MEQLAFNKLLKNIEDNGGLRNFFDTIRNSDLSDDNRILVTVWEEDLNAKFAWENRYEKNIPISRILRTGEFGVANSITMSPKSYTNEFAVTEIIKRNLILGCNIELCGKSPNIQVYSCIVEEGENVGDVYCIIVKILENKDKM